MSSNAFLAFIGFCMHSHTAGKTRTRATGTAMTCEEFAESECKLPSPRAVQDMRLEIARQIRISQFKYIAPR
jgi:hypothetical protein